VAAIRPYRPQDAEAIAALTLAAIRETGLRAYSPVQVAAWSARYSVQRLLDRPLAYTVLEESGHLDMLYCRPDHTGRGLAAALLAAAEAAARMRGVTRLFAEASELARPVFARAGYVLLQRRDFTIDHPEGPVAIHNYAMEKALV